MVLKVDTEIKFQKLIEHWNGSWENKELLNFKKSKVTYTGRRQALKGIEIRSEKFKCASTITICTMCVYGNYFHTQNGKINQDRQNSKKI